MSARTARYKYSFLVARVTQNAKTIIQHVIFDKKNAKHVVFHKHFGADRIGVRREKQVLFFTYLFGRPKIKYFQVIFDTKNCPCPAPPSILL